MITQELVKELFDYQDGNLIRKTKVATNANIGDIVGTLDGHGYLQFRINNRLYRLHRVVFLWHHGYLPQCVDHIDGNPLNNRIENLRAATKLENNRNTTVRKDNKAGVKNVYWSKSASRWVVHIRVEGKLKHIGLFDDIELAELVAIEAREKFHGKFARHF
jgi:hypothetical protein